MRFILVLFERTLAMRQGLKPLPQSESRLKPTKEIDGKYDSF
jgi:hypothetical protein